MTRDIWVISDTHFNHENIIKYCDRPFDNVHHMNETIVENWNAVVKPEDIVYHCGDVYFSKKADSTNILGRLNGRKRLILGNHDDGKDKLLLNTFQKILAWRMFPEFGLLLSHFPVHQGSMRGHKAGVDLVNVHGHTHQNLVLLENSRPDRRYKNVSVEQTGYVPVNIETLRNR